MLGMLKYITSEADDTKYNLMVFNHVPKVQKHRQMLTKVTILKQLPFVLTFLNPE